MRLYLLDGGRIEILDWALFQPDAGPAVHRWLSDPCYLVVHPQGTLVWDTGLPSRLATEPDGLTIPDVAVFHVDRPLAVQLDELGHPAAGVDYLALSHFHPDHVGNVELFGAATLLVQADEYAAALGDRAADHGFDQSGYAALRSNPVLRLEGDHDVFGDGAVVIKRLPGHTVGGQSLLLRLPESGPVLISGDLAHSIDNWRRGVVPALNHDATQTKESLRVAAEMVEAEGADFWVQHDADQYAGLRHAPAFYA